MLRQAVREEQQDVSRGQRIDLVDLVAFLVAEHPGRHELVEVGRRREHAERREGDHSAIAQRAEAAELSGKDERLRVARRDETERAPGRDLAVDHRHVLVDGRGLVEALVDVLEELRRDLAKAIELVIHTEQERLMQHRGDHRVGEAMSRHVGHENAGPIAALPELGGHRLSVLALGERDAPLQVIAPLEVDVDDVIAAEVPVQRQRAPVDVEAAQSGNGAGRSPQRLRQLAKVAQLFVGGGIEYFGGHCSYFLEIARDLGMAEYRYFWWQRQ